MKKNIKIMETRNKHNFYKGQKLLTWVVGEVMEITITDIDDYNVFFTHAPTVWHGVEFTGGNRSINLLSHIQQSEELKKAIKRMKA